MDFVNSISPPIRGFLEPLTSLSSFFILSLVALIAFVSWSSNSKEPPHLWGAIPFISNQYQYLTNQGKFLERAASDVTPSYDVHR